MTRTDDLRRRHTPRSAREVIGASIGADPYEQIEHIRELGRRKAEAAGVAYQLEQERKHLLARIASEHEGSEAARERMARADDRYRDHLRGTAEAIKRRELANSEYWAARSLLEWDRAALAHLNALSKLEEPA